MGNRFYDDIGLMRLLWRLQHTKRRSLSGALVEVQDGSIKISQGDMVTALSPTESQVPMTLDRVTLISQSQV